MTNLAPAPGISSKFHHAGRTYSDVFALEHTQTQERVETTGMGQLYEAFVPGKISVLEITLRFYGTSGSGIFTGSPSVPQQNLEIGTSLLEGYVHFASQMKVAWTDNNASVLSHNATAGVDGAVEHEITLAVSAYTRSYATL